MGTREIASTILNQLTNSSNGAGRLKIMVGAKDFAFGQSEDGEPYVTFKFKMSKKANAVSIYLTHRDEYDMVFLKNKPLTSKNLLSGEDLTTIVEEFEGLYFDQLKDVFETFTGLDLAL